MIRILVFIVAIAFIALGLTWLADQPGTLQVDWFGYAIQTSAFVGAIAIVFIASLVVVLWGLARFLVTRPTAVAHYWRERRRRQGFEALTGGLLAIGTGDRSGAEYYAGTARRLLPHEPLTALLRAQTLQLKDDREGARRAFEAMLDNPKTELLGLRGLFLEARRRNDAEAATRFVEQAVERNPDLGWGVTALLDLQARAGDWEGALKTLAIARQHDHVDAKAALRRRAVLLTAEAQGLEETDPDQALHLATEAQRLVPSLIPAAEIAGRILASKGEARRAGRTILKTWKLAPHPDLALVYAHATPGESPKERLARVKYLASYNPDNIESHIAVANAAIEAQAWDEARMALAPYLGDRPSARICTLMARIEAGEFGDRGREREWLARAVRAPRDRAWVADGYISDRWLPVSPVTGKLDAFEWRAPVDAIGRGDQSLVIEARPPDEPPAGPPAGMPEILPARPKPAPSNTPPAIDAEFRQPPTPEQEPAQDVRSGTGPNSAGEASPIIEATAQETKAPEIKAPETKGQDASAAGEAPTSKQPPAAPASPPEAPGPNAVKAEAQSPASEGDAHPVPASEQPLSRAYREPPFIPSRPPDDPGVGDDGLEEDLTSDLERLRSAQAR